ncbi:MAG: YkgJ family cysteine cluster protein [Cyclobacteriaceae bacterium]|nr:YkgJ family cysteine cluster protein [Cyclobacteriaceae bacterium]
MSAKECDCSNGQRLGCKTYCCRLIVRMTEEESERLFPGEPYRRSLSKNMDGYCIFLDKESHACMVWDKRPSDCAAFNCNEDKKLQHVLQTGIISLVKLSEMAVKSYLPQEVWIQV